MMTTQSGLWWQHGVIYQIYPRSFKDSNGDGIGDLMGIIEKLDYLHDLGVQALWLSPFYPSPMADFGYDVAHYTDVDPIFGDLAAFDSLVAEAHARDLHVIIDFVPNHSSDQHPWFIESQASRDNPKRDWYVWADPKPDGSLPNNWLSVFGGPAWEFDAKTGQYYLHSFLKQQPDLNWRNPQVKTAMFDAIRFWLDRGVDGFRIDVAHFIMKDPDLRDNPLNTEFGKNLHKSFGDYDSIIHLHDKGHADVHKVFQEFRQILNGYSTPRFSVGEIHIFDWPEWSTYYGAALDELHMPFNFALIGAAWQADVVRSVVEGIEKHLPTGAWPNYVLGNHDEHRIASRIGADAARTAMMLLLTLRGTPTLYYGDEIGMHDVEIPPDRIRDPWDVNVPGLGLGRDPERTPMQWDGTPHAGFTASGGDPWLPIADDYGKLNVAVEKDDPRSMYTLTRRLLALRRERAPLHAGKYQTIDPVQAPCLMYMRQYEEDRILVALNFSAVEQPLNFASYVSGHLLLSTYLDREGQVDLSSFALRPHEGCIIQLD
jgi:glycosidase